MIALAAAVVIVPQIGRVFGLRIGLDTMEQLERRLGPGKAITGGHPHGARLWISSDRLWVICADGFDYGHGGRLVQDFRLDRNDGSIKAPIARSADLGVLARIRPNMSRTEVREAIARLKGRRVGDAFSQTGKADVKHATNPHVDHLREWRASFGFESRGLTTITFEGLAKL
jgi:hypothetical protein